MKSEAFSVSITRSNRLAAMAFVVALIASGSVTAQTSDEWRWSVTPYIWGSDVAADVSFPSGQAVGGELSFDDILDDLDFAALLHFEGHRGQWGMFFDVTYLDMSDDTTRGQVATSAEAKFGLYELAAVYTPGGEKGPFSAFAGARIVDVSLDIDFRAPAPIAGVRRSADTSLTDFMAGARYVYSLNDRWALNLRGDIGAGDTEQDWSVSALVGWRFGHELNYAVLVGWRHLELELEESGRKTEVAFDGPLVGVLFGW